MMSFRDFSAALIRSGDLDPDYLIMKAYAEENNLPRPILLTWIIYKVFIYDTASEIKVLFHNASISKVKHGAERRKNKNNTEQQLSDFLIECDLPGEFLNEGHSLHYRDFKKHVTQFPGIGSWAAWKYGDLLERVAGCKLDFTVDFREAYDFPLKGLARVNGATKESEDYLVSLLKGPESSTMYLLYMNNAIKQLGPVWSYEAPGGGRALNLQELETCLCKYHSYLNGHYKLGQDTAHVIDRFNEEGLKLPEKVFKFFKQFINQNLFE